MRGTFLANESMRHELFPVIVRSKCTKMAHHFALIIFAAKQQKSLSLI